MKKIKLIRYSAPVQDPIVLDQKLYWVSLGNGFKSSFASEKETLAFLAETNRELNSKMYELNFLYSDVVRLYRSSWLNFESSSTNNIEYLCSEKIKMIENSFNLMIDRSGFENGNHTVFAHFHSIINQIKSICELLGSMFKKRNLTGALYECDSYTMRADYIATAIIIYPNKIKLAVDKLQPVQLKKVV